MNLFRIVGFVFFLVFSSLVSMASPLMPNVSFKASSEGGKTNDEVTVKITVENFTDIAGIQWTLRWDPTVVEYKSLQDFALPDLNSNSFNVSKASQGFITTSWYYFQGASKNNGETIFTVKFKLVGVDGKFSNFDFSSTPLAIEISDKNAQKITADFTSGKVNVGTVVNPPAGTTLKAGTIETSKDQEVCIPITVTGFKSVNAMQFSMSWDAAVITFTKLQKFAGINPFDQSSFNTLDAANGKLVCVWFDQSTNGQTVADGTALFEICYKYTGPCPGSSNISFTDTPTKILLNASPGGSLTVTKEAGKISANTCTTVLTATSAKITHPCPSQSNGALQINTTGGSGTLTYLWSNGATTKDVTGLAAGTYNVTVTDGTGTKASLSAGITLVALNGSNSVTAPSGGQNNGSINLTVSGGNTPYTFKWSNNATTEDISSLGIGSYSVTVTDATGCTLTQTASVGEIALAITTAIATDVLCKGQSNGAVNLSISGGTGPFTYKWTGPNNYSASTEDIADLKAGTYKATVTDSKNVSVSSADIIVKEPSLALKIVSTTKNESATGNDGEIILKPEGGTPAYTYKWNDNSSNSSRTSLVKGSYNVAVTDSKGCTTTANFTIQKGVSELCFTSQRVFTPNGDGFNEVFVINCSETISNQLLVYNRWNQLVYKTDNYINNWEGIDLKGFKLPDGVYYWVLKETNNSTNSLYKGYVTLIRELN